MKTTEQISLPSNSYFLDAEKSLMLVIRPSSDLDLLHWIHDNKNILRDYLVKFGGVLFRGFNIHSLSEFNQAAQLISTRLLDYTFRSTPRTKLGGKIYTSTHYPANRKIPQHNENSYTNSWPNIVMFFCAIPSEIGGETPVASSYHVLQDLDPIVVEKFKKFGVMYVRNYINDIDLNWKEVFQTESKEEVENYCTQQGIECYWNPEGPELTTKQVCQATVKHPITNQEVWFNQAHLFNILSLPKQDQVALLNQYNSASLPRNSYYGNNEVIESSVIEHIQSCYDKHTLQFKWEKNDLMILDNVLMTHGRNSFAGERKIVVAMGE